MKTQMIISVRAEETFDRSQEKLEPGSRRELAQPEKGGVQKG